MGQVNANGPAESILARIRLALDALDPAQRKVARFFLENSDVIGGPAHRDGRARDGRVGGARW